MKKTVLCAVLCVRNIDVMLSKNEVKYIQSLCHKKHRDQEGLFVAEGPKLADELLNSNFKIEGIYATSEWLDKHEAHKINVVEVSEEMLQRMSNLQTANEVLIVAHQRHENDLNVASTISIVLDGIQDPGNMGSIIRIADWFGIDQIIAGNDTADIYNPKVVQASMGSFCRVQVWYQDLINFFSVTKTPVYGALLNGQSIYEVDKIKEGILLIGNEGKGISEILLPYIHQPITIPRIGQAESLNAAVATGIILSHIISH